MPARETGISHHIRRHGLALVPVPGWHVNRGRDIASIRSRSSQDILATRDKSPPRQRCTRETSIQHGQQKPGPVFYCNGPPEHHFARPREGFSHIIGTRCVDSGGYGVMIARLDTTCVSRITINDARRIDPPPGGVREGRLHAASPPLGGEAAGTAPLAGIAFE